MAKRTATRMKPSRLARLRKPVLIDLFDLPSRQRQPDGAGKTAAVLVNPSPVLKKGDAETVQAREDKLGLLLVEPSRVNLPRAQPGESPTQQGLLPPRSGTEAVDDGARRAPLTERGDAPEKEDVVGDASQTVMTDETDRRGLGTLLILAHVVDNP
jgi:hypothetical protein